MKYSYEQISNTGSRIVNEDSVGVCRGEDSLLLALADGLGGHGKGEVASQLVIADAMAQYKLQEKQVPRAVLEHCFVHCQEILLKEQAATNSQNSMKTTLNLAIVKDNCMFSGHIGDSRTYFFRKNKLLWRTLDHSVPQVLVATGEIKEKNIRHHPDRNRLLRVLGIDGVELRYELENELTEMRSNDAVLLCSDGFWELITEKEMQKCLKSSKTAMQWLEKMNEIVQKNGKLVNMDNNSAIVLFAE
ncbi:MAG: protein phosphatase 2C domain-containing protein [Christensenella sp.]